MKWRLHVSTNFRCCRTWLDESRVRGTGPQIKTTAHWVFGFLATRAVVNEWFDRDIRLVTMRTVFCRCFGFHSYYQQFVLLLILDHWRKKLQWLKQRFQWYNEYKAVIFCKESLFCLVILVGHARKRRKLREVT